MLSLNHNIAETCNATYPWWEIMRVVDHRTCCQGFLVWTGTLGLLCLIWLAGPHWVSFLLGNVVSDLSNSVGDYVADESQLIAPVWTDSIFLNCNIAGIHNTTFQTINIFDSMSGDFVVFSTKKAVNDTRCRFRSFVKIKQWTCWQGWRTGWWRVMPRFKPGNLRRKRRIRAS